MPARVLTELDIPKWDGWLAAIGSSTVEQTSTYRKGLALYGYRSEVIAVERDERFRGGALLGIRPVAPMIGPLVHASGGLVLEDRADPGDLAQLLEALIERCRQLKATRIEITLRVPVQRGEVIDPKEKTLAQVLRHYGFEPAAARGTYHVDLRAESEDELLGRFDPETRRKVEEAARAGLRVDRAETPEEFGAFGRANHEMCRRRGLPLLPERYPAEVLLPLARAGQGDLFVARFAGTLRDSLFVGTIGMPVREKVGVADAASETGCPPTSELLHYRAMCHYRARGRPLFDLGGAQGPVPDPSDPDFPHWKFKHGFNGTYVRFLGSWERTLRPMDAALLGLVRRGLALRRSLARLR
jgi:lipid II:glycine glycyltransferase (peptidoglycan interpeptide bridge formation enzyme)